MNKIRLVAAAALAGAITVLSPGAAQAYPDCSVDIDVDRTIIGGRTLEFRADVEGGGVDGDFTATFNGDSASGSGSSYSDSFDTPEVDAKTNKTLQVSFRSAPDSELQATCNASVTITLLPAGSVADPGDDNGALPNTGGSNLWLLVAGGALLIGGGGVTYAARRRHDSARHHSAH